MVWLSYVPTVLEGLRGAAISRPVRIAILE